MITQADLAQVRRSRLDWRLAIHLTISIFVWLACAGCATKGVVIENTPAHSLSFIRYVVTHHLPRGLRVTSTNNREYFSNYFSPFNLEEDATEKRERATAQVIVLGDRRPYRTEVRVYIERKTNSGYQATGLDKNLARDLANKLQEELAKGRDERNIIDDFRPF